MNSELLSVTQGQAIRTPPAFLTYIDLFEE